MRRTFGLFMLLLMALLCFPALSSAASATATVTWQAVTADPPVTAYRVDRAIWGQPYTEVATIPAPALNYTDSGLALNTNYCYKITTLNAFGVGPTSGPVCKNSGGLPGTPTGIAIEYTFLP